MKPLKLAYLSLIRHRFSTIITVIAVGLSVACGGILLRLYNLSESRFSTMGHGGDAIIGAKSGGIEIMLDSLNAEGSYPDFLPYKLFESLRAEQNVKFEDGQSIKPTTIRSIIPFIYFGKFENYRVVGTDDSFYHRPNDQESLVISSGRWFQNKNEIVIGSAVASARGIKVGDSIKINPWITDEPSRIDLDFTVVGIALRTDSQWDRTLFASVADAHQVIDRFPELIARRSIWGPNVLNYFLVYLSPGGFSKLESLINRRTVAQVVNIEEQKDKLKEITGVGKSVGFFVTLLVILLGGLSVCSLFVTRFESMALQLAVLRALGYTRFEISKWLLWEGFLLGCLGVLLGMAVDAFVFPILRGSLGSALPPPDLVASSILDSSSVWCMAILATVVAVLLPVIRMAGQDTHSALKGL